MRIAENIDVGSFNVKACCLGEVLSHKVFNDRGRKPDAVEAFLKVAVVQLPCLTGNGMSWSLKVTDSPSLSAPAPLHFQTD